MAVEDRKIEERARFTVNTDTERSQNLHVRIMLALRNNFYDLYEIYAKGRNNVKVAEKTVEKLSRYIEIESVKASRKDAQPILQIRITRNPRFTEVFYRKKGDVQDKRLLESMCKNKKA